MDSTPTLWRMNIKTDSQPGVDPHEFCIEKRITGIGWGFDQKFTKADEYWQAANAVSEGKLGKSWTSAANAIIHRMNDGDLVWSRNGNGTYFLGEIIGPWEHQTGEEFKAADIRNTRGCDWKKVGTMDNVPGAVINAFRPPAAVQVVTDESAAQYSRRLFDQLSGRTPQSLKTDDLDIISLISDEDLEDVVVLFLQTERNCVVFASTCKKDTKNVECILASRSDGSRVGVQVKSGSFKPDFNLYSEFEGKVYLFSASGQFDGVPNDRCECISPDAIREFVIANHAIMPGRIQNWLRFAR